MSNNHENNQKEFPLYKNVLLTSFFITFLIVVSTAGFAFVYQTKQLENQLTEQATGVASIWGVTISPEEVIKAIALKDKESPVIKKLNKSVSMLHELNDHFIDGYIIDAKKLSKNKLWVIAESERFEALGIESYHSYVGENVFIEPFDRAVKAKKTTSSKVYHDIFGTWITAFEPIIDKNGEVIGVLAVDIDATSFENFKLKLLIYLSAAIIIITVILYFTLRWGLTKVLKPVDEIISGINAVSTGNFNVKVTIPDQSNMAKLGKNFNYMTDQLSILFERLSDTYKEFGSERIPTSEKHSFEVAIGEMEKIIANSKIQKELQRAEKMNAIGQLAAAVAHEIRNPMTVVRGFLQIFIEKDHFTEKEKTYFQLMFDELNRAEAIINDYLSLAKPNLDQINDVNASHLAEKVMDLMNTFALLSKNISLKTNFDYSVYVKGNESDLTQVLINMVKNGIEAMQSGGTLTLNVKKSNEYGVFEIIDTGIGMSQGEISRLGTAFYSLKETGTGIGLMVCYQIIEKMKGKITVESKKGKGTTFKILIPLSEHN